MKKRIVILVVCFVLLCAALIAVFWDPIIDWLPIDQSKWKTMKTGQIRYLDEDGDPVSGWYEVESNIYYFDPASFAMQTGWVDLSDGRYYLGSDGIRRTGWQTIDGKRFYLDENGAMFTGWLETDEGMLYLNAQGNPQSGWVELEEGTYYLDENSIRQSGWLELDEKQFYFDEDGRLHTGWLELEEGTYYLNGEGNPLTGWQTVEDKVYYLNEEGIMQTGWLELDGNRYYLCGDGSRYTGWLDMGEYQYYLKEDGTAAKGRLDIDGQTHYFTSTGAEVILVNTWNKLSEDYVPELVDIPYGRASVDCADALLKMIEDCTAAGCSPQIVGGYRDYGAQNALFYFYYNQYKADGKPNAYTRTRQRVALAGASEHQLGLAFDITDKRYPQKYTGADNAVEWLSKNCWEYGFILRYPDGKTDITGIMKESWHFRYVGAELAMELKDSGLCLEEYLDALTNDGTTCGNPDAVKTEAAA
ncbi:MAG: D-alanyl-D-alanine carboxypeptidase family protein [Oscillospiraceae bacterium]|nr:D-alanyl-D-alanine carboxypeptidase family protein [Oscillospiraceae bacterium]